MSVPHKSTGFRIGIRVWLGCICLLMVGCGAPSEHAMAEHARQKAERVFTMNLGTEPPTLDPAEASDLISMTVLANVFRGLTRFGDGQQVEPACAERWEQSADGHRYVFHLRKNARWSDGRPVTSQDFVYAWRRALDPKTGSPYAFLLFDIHNAQALYEGKLKDSSQLGVQAPDPQTLSVQLDRPTAFFLQVMAFSISLPLREDVVKRYGPTFTEAGHLVTNGPYTLARWEHENEMLLRPNPLYWDGAPPNAGVKMVMIREPNTSLIMYENSELDFVETTSSLPTKEVRRLQGRADFHQQTLNAISYFGFNTQKKPFDNVRVRQAFIHAFDRTFIPKLFQGGEKPVTSFIPEGLFGENPKIGLGFDVQRAQHYLAEAGYPGGKGFPKVTLLYANTTPENRQLAEIAQFQWQQNLHVQVDIQNVEWKIFLKQLDEDPPQIYRLQWFVDYPDPDSAMGVFYKASGNNYTRWHSPIYDSLISKAAITPNGPLRQAMYDLAQWILLEESAVVMPLYVIPKTYLLKPDVEGFSLNTLNLVTLDKLHFRSAP